MTERGERKLEKIGQGCETEVFKHTKEFSGGEKKEGGTVVKNFEGLNGLDEDLRNELQTIFKTYKNIYGADLFPKQHFIPDKEHPGKFLLVQEKISIAKPGNIFDYTEKSLPDSARERLIVLVDSLKESYRLATDLEHPVTDPSENAPLDLNNGNLVVTTDGQLKQIDTGALMTNYGASMGYDILQEHVVARIGALECVLGREPKEFLHDKIYDDFLAYCHVSKHPSSTWDKDLRNNINAKNIFLNIGKLIAEDNEKKRGGRV
jgi:hypothetical protein